MINISSMPLGKYSAYMQYLYKLCSEDKLPEKIGIPNPAWEPFIDKLYECLNQPKPIKTKYINPITTKTDIPLNNKDIIIAFSGGKDSTAYATYLKDRGHNLTFFYQKGINKSYPNEYQTTLNIAKKLDAKTYINNITLSGKTTRAENPVKNYLILAYMIDYMIPKRLTHSCFGTYIHDTTENISAFFGLSDSYDIYKLFEQAVQYTFPNFRWVCFIEDMLQAHFYLYEKHLDLLYETDSCLLPNMYREKLKKENEAKYNFTLAKNRCLSCYKCALEYYVLNKLGYIKVPQQVIAQKIIPQLKKDLQKNTSEEQLSKINIKTLTESQIVYHHLELDINTITPDVKQQMIDNIESIYKSEMSR